MWLCYYSGLVCGPLACVVKPIQSKKKLLSLRRKKSCRVKK